MTQAMRVLDESAQGRRVEASPARGDEQRVLGAARELGSCVAEVARDEQCRLFAERDDAVLAAFAFAHVYALLLEVDVAEVEADRFGGAQPGRVDELDECGVPETERPVARDRLDELLDLALLGRVRQATRPAWGQHGGRDMVRAEREPKER